MIKAIMRLNKKFGVFHTMDMLGDREALFRKCTDKREMALVSDFLSLWETEK